MRNNKSILITGGSGNIGSGVMNHFLQLGWNVLCASRTAPSATHSNLYFYKCDLTIPGAGCDLINEISAQAINLQVIVNNAARQDVHLLGSEPTENVQEIFQVNVMAVAEIYAEIARAKLPIQSVINISSIEAVVARQGHSIYGATKSALESLTRTAALELAPIRSNSLRLGLIHRDGIELGWPGGVKSWKENAPLGRLGTVADICHGLDFLIDATWVTGNVLTLDGGISVASSW